MVWVGSLEFTIVSVGAPSEDDGEEGSELYSQIALYCDSDEDIVKGGEFLLFEADVYDENGDVIAGTDDVAFTAEEVTTSEASALSDSENTYIDENALFVAGDVTERGVASIIVTATYVDKESGTEYAGEYELYVQAGESPLEIGLTVDGTEITALSGSTDTVYQLFPANPSSKGYNFSAKYNGTAASDVTWSIEPDGDWYTVDTDGDFCCAYAIVDEEDNGYDWTPEGATPVADGDEVARINVTTGEFEVLIDDTFPYSMAFDITAECTVDGETYENSAYLFLGRVVANFLMLNGDEESGSIDAHTATYTAVEDSTINLAFSLNLHEEAEEIDVDSLQNWTLYEGQYAVGGTEIDGSLYAVAVDSDEGTATLTIPASSAISAENLYLQVEYDHGEIAPRTPDGVSTAGLRIVESSAATDEGEVDHIKIVDEYNDTSAVYAKGTYQKVKLEAYPCTANGSYVGEGSVTWAFAGGASYDNVKLVQNGFSAEVWLLKADADEISVRAMYHKPGESGIHKDAAFTITAEDASGDAEAEATFLPSVSAALNQAAEEAADTASSIIGS